MAKTSVMLYPADWSVEEYLALLRKFPFIKAVTLYVHQWHMNAAFRAAGYDVGTIITDISQVEGCVQHGFDYVFLGDEPNVTGASGVRITPQQYMAYATPMATMLRQLGFRGVIGSASLTYKKGGWFGTPEVDRPYLEALVNLGALAVFDALSVNFLEVGHAKWKAVLDVVAPNKPILCLGWSFINPGPDIRWLACLPGLLGGWEREFQVVKSWGNLKYDGLWCLGEHKADQWHAWSMYGLAKRDGTLLLNGSRALEASRFL
jgi:hypothetical protein